MNASDILMEKARTKCQKEAYISIMQCTLANGLEMDQRLLCFNLTNSKTHIRSSKKSTNVWTEFLRKDRATVKIRLMIRHRDFNHEVMGMKDKVK